MSEQIIQSSSMWVLKYGNKVLCRNGKFKPLDDIGMSQLWLFNSKNNAFVKAGVLMNKNKIMEEDLNQIEAMQVQMEVKIC